MCEKYEVEAETFTEQTEDVILIRSNDGSVDQIVAADDEDGECDA